VVPRWIWARINDDLFLNRPVASLRTSQWKFAWHLVQQRPLTGWGLRNFTPLYNAEMQFYIGHPHNVPLMLMAEMGIPATLIFYGMVGWVMYRGVMWVREARWVVGAADRAITVTFLTVFLACTLFSFFDVTFFDVRINTLNWLILAAIWGVGQMPVEGRSGQSTPPSL
jgi:O-antigen ligase